MLNNVMSLEGYKQVLNLANQTKHAEIEFIINTPSTINLDFKQGLGQELL